MLTETPCEPPSAFESRLSEIVVIPGDDTKELWRFRFGL